MKKLKKKIRTQNVISCRNRGFEKMARQVGYDSNSPNDLKLKTKKDYKVRYRIN